MKRREWHQDEVDMITSALVDAGLESFELIWYERDDDLLSVGVRFSPGSRLPRFKLCDAEYDLMQSHQMRVKFKTNA